MASVKRMQRDVGVGMTGQRVRVRNAHAAERDMIAGAEGMHVDAGAGAHVAERGEGGGLRAGKILAVVILMLPVSPANAVTVSPAHSASAASSVKSSRPAAAALRCASSKAGKAKACGVCTRRKLARSSVPVTRPAASTDLTVSVTGSAGMAAPLCRAASMAREASCRAGEGPRRVMHQHDLGRMRGERFEPGAHRHLPRRAAEHRRQRLQSGGRGLIELDIVAVDHRLYEADARDVLGT